MLTFLDDQLLDDAVSRAEQSRFSYNLQAEEFRTLNTNLQRYLNDIKTIDDENHQLQDNIEQIRSNYLTSLENHLKRLPEDFRQESSILTEAHLERYKSKARAKRFLHEREELKKRIHFLSTNDKDQAKRLNSLQKQERSVQNEFKNLNEQIQNLCHYIEIEKQTHRQAMDKVDHLQIQLEQISIERSRTEFEIQTLREEVKLMQTAKEFLDDEHQTILSAQTDANEYLLSRLNESIERIREDFNELNQTQFKQIENEYKQMMNVMEENLLTKTANDETLINQQRTAQNEYDKLQDDQRSITQELTTLNSHNQVLSERILAMEDDLYSIRDERIRELVTKDNELERSKTDLHLLNEKLNHLTEYDRNLKFELTLYRGVLESEYRRKQKVINNQQPVQPTTLVQSYKIAPISTSRYPFEPPGRKPNVQFDETISTINYLNDEEIETKDELESKNIASQEERQTPTETIESPISVISADQQPSSDVQSSPTTHRTTNTGSSPSPDQSVLDVSPTACSVVHQLSTTPPESPIMHARSPVKEEASLTSSNLPTSPEVQQASSTPSEDRPISTIPSSTGTEIASEANKSPTEDHQPSSAQPEDPQDSSEVHHSLTASQEDVQSLSTDEQRSSETQKSPTSPNNTTPPTDLSSSTPPYNHQTVSPDIPPNEQSNLTEPSTTPSKEDRSILLNIQRKASTTSQEQQTPTTVKNIDGHISPIFADDDQLHATAASPTEQFDNVNQLSELLNEHNHGVDHEERTQSSSFDLPHTLHEEIERNLNSPDNNKLITEEQISSSDQNTIEEDNKIDYISSDVYYNKLFDSSHLTNQTSNQQSLDKTSLTDVDDDNTNSMGEVNSSTSPETEDANQPNLEAVMQDLRYIYRDLINDENLVEINDDFPDNLIDRLEFGDNLIRLVFDSILKKYLVQPVKAKTRSNTLDWIEFRDILFPVVTGRYMERHIRKLFELFDTSKDGYLSMEEIIELLELLQINNTTDLAQNMMNEFDNTQDGKLSVDEFIDAVKKADEINNNILSEEIESKSWYTEHPIEDSQPLSLEVPNVNFQSKNNYEIILLARIFKRVGANVENKQLDCTKPTLSMRITNEFVHNNIQISSYDLQAFIELYLNQKQKSDRFIKWIEFRDVFLPLVNGGICSKDDIERWFGILDENQNGRIIPEQILHLLRLIQITNPEEILNKMNEIWKTDTNNNGSWVLEELIFALENLDETTVHLISTNEQVTSFDLNWFTQNIF